MEFLSKTDNKMKENKKRKERKKEKENKRKKEDRFETCFKDCPIM